MRPTALLFTILAGLSIWLAAQSGPWQQGEIYAPQAQATPTNTTCECHAIDPDTGWCTDMQVSVPWYQDCMAVCCASLINYLQPYCQPGLCPAVTPTPTPTPPPPSVDVAFACAQPGQNGWCRGGAGLTWNATVPGGGTVSGDWGDGTTFSQVCSGSCSNSYTPGDGTGTAQVTASAAGGTASDSAFWAVDTTAPTANPTVSGTVGQNGWYVSRATISANAVDTTSGVASVEYQVDGGAWQSGTSVTLEDGVHQVAFRVTDNAGNVMTTPAQAVKVDTTAPVLNPSVPVPDGQNGWFVTAPQVDASGSDATSGLASLQCRVDGGAWQAPPVSVSGDGAHTVECQAQDRAGNVSTWSETVQIDTTAPVLNPSMPSPDGQNGWFVTAPVQVDASGSDATSGLAALECRVDGGAWQAPPVSVSGDGAHTVECQAQDNAGNTTSWSQSLQVDTTEPVSTFTYPSDGATVFGVVNLTGTSTDTTSGVASVEISTDGGQTWQQVAGTTWAYSWDTRPLPDGTYTLMARAQDNAGNQERTAVVHVIVANAPPEAALRPNEWVFWQKALVRVQANPYVPIKRVRITITDTYKPGRVRVWEYPGEIPGEETFIIQWDARWYSENGPAAFTGEYPVKIEVWDIYGRKAMTTGTVVVPPQPTATFPPTVTPAFTPTPTPTSTPTLSLSHPNPTATLIPPTPVPTSMPVLMPTATFQPEQTEPPKSHPAVVWLLGAVGFLGLVFTLDPRPKAIKALRQTLSRYLEVRYHD